MWNLLQKIPLFKVRKERKSNTGKNKRLQAKCPQMCEMSVCGEYVYNMYVKQEGHEALKRSPEYTGQRSNIIWINLIVWNC